MSHLLPVVFLLIGCTVAAQPDSVDQSGRNLLVAVRSAPPYSMQDEAGNWHGMAIDLWREVAEANRWTYSYVNFQTEDEVTAALLGGGIDVITLASLTDTSAQRLGHSYPYHMTSLGVALPKASGLWSTIKGIFSLQFLYIVAGLCVLLLVVGVAVYLVEKSSNEDQFGGERSTWEGIGSGFWWAGVTMTTIGYGDKAPRTFFGRTIAMLWMLVALAVTSSLTAAIITATEARKAIQFPQDLSKLETGVAEDSPAAKYLRELGQSTTSFRTALEGLKAREENTIEAFVDDVTTLRYLTDEHRQLGANVQETSAKPIYYTFAVRPDSPLIESLDRALLRTVLTERWREIVKQYGGQRSSSPQ